MAIVHFILNERHADAVQLLALLRRHQAEPFAAMPKRPELAGKTLEQISENVMEILTEGLLSGDKDRKETCQNILAHLGEGAIPCFVRMIKKAPDLRQRRLAASALKYYGAPGKNKLAAEFHLGNGSEILLNVLSVLDDFLSPDLVPRFQALMHYPDATIRRRIIQLLSKIQDPAAGKLLLSFLDDPDEASQIDAIRAAGETKNRTAVPKLTELLKTGSTRRLEETCLALGQIGEGQAVPALSEIIEPKSAGLFKRKTAIEETVRVRAAWALAQIRTPESREFLSKMTKDQNLQVQTIARNALES
jgi:HEAT repeat protein